MKFTAAGDVLIQRRIPEGFEGIDEIAPFICRGDARFFNLETTLHYEGECYASQFSGGTYVRTDPEMLDDVLKFGFNMTSFNNNHTMDFSYEGMLRTLEEVNCRGLVNSGVGENLAQASAPQYLDTVNGRVALIGVNSYFEPCMMAGNAGQRVPGRPGINGVRIEERIEVTAEQLQFIRQLSDLTGVNDTQKIHRAQGYKAELADNVAEFGDLQFVVGEKPRQVKTLNEEDMTRIVKSIEEAKFQADYVLVSIHTHHLVGDREENVPQFMVDFAHRCIDAGAHAILGHGPHLLRPIEVYKDCPIFYSLGDFVLELYSVAFGPEDFYNKQGMDSRSTIHDLLKKRSKGFTIGLMEDERMLTAVVPYWETEGTKLKSLTLMPVTLTDKSNKSRHGLPRKAPAEKIAAYLGEMSAPYGTKLSVTDDGLIKCEW